MYNSNDSRHGANGQKRLQNGSAFFKREDHDLSLRVKNQSISHPVKLFPGHVHFKFND